MSDAVLVSPSARRSRERLVIGASSLGTMFEWYDFFLYGALATHIARHFFSGVSETTGFIFALAAFAAGFIVRPLGALVFGRVGDVVGRKNTFLVTMGVMGLSTFVVGLLPGYDTIGFAAPVILILLRLLQGLAIGGEYGGAAIYVSEHAPPDKRGFYTSFIQASVVGGFVLSLVVVLGCKAVMSDELWNDWGWRVPFLLSLLLLGVSLWMRLKLSESPVFKAMKAQGELASNPFVESFTYPGNKKRLFVALFGIAAGLTVIWYTAMFSALSFLKGPMRVNDTAAEIIVGLAASISMIFYIYFGALSDKLGRKKPIVWGYALSLVLIFPLFWLIGSVANPALSAAMERAPVTISGPQCDYSPFAKEQETECGKLLAQFTAKGVSYTLRDGPDIAVKIGNTRVTDTSSEGIDAALKSAGYDFTPRVPPVTSIAIIVLALCGLGALSAATYGPVAALLAEMFPARIRYSSMSIPYHFGTGYFGGFLPFIASFIIAKTGNPYSGLWYTWAVVLMAFMVSMFLLKETHQPGVEPEHR